MSVELTGFVVRAAAGEEAAQITRQFGSSPLLVGTPVVYGAFGQPGDVPLGGLIVKPFGKASAHFQIMVRPEFRRRKVGAKLMETLFDDARRQQTSYLQLAALVHQDLPDNAFYRKMGLTAERSFATYAISLANRVLPIFARTAARFQQQHSADAQVVAIDQVKPERIARFFSDHYGDVFEHRLEQFQTGVYDTAISTAIVSGDDTILAANLVRSRPGNSAIFVELILIHPDHRNGLLPLVLLEATARFAIRRGLSDGVFEADAEHDSFATGIASRGGCQPQWHRYRYSIQIS